MTLWESFVIGVPTDSSSVGACAQRVSAALLAGVLLVVLSSCTNQQQFSVNELDSRAMELWDYHAKTVRQGIEGPITGEEFLQSCIFLEDLTGITISLNLSTVGAIPVEGADEDFERIAAWFEENKHRLYYDEKESKVKVRAP